LGGCMGEYRRARGSLHVRGPFWLRSQVPIRRPKGHSFTQDEVYMNANTNESHQTNTICLKCFTDVDIWQKKLFAPSLICYMHVRMDVSGFEKKETF
jgi:hypothetical protein